MIRRIDTARQAVIATALLAACATPPKPQELEAFERMQKQPAVKTARDQQKALVGESEQAHKKAVAAWEDEDLERAKHFAVLASVKLKTALALVEQETLEKQIAETRAQISKVTDEQKELADDLGEADEKIALYTKLNAAKSAKAKQEAMLKLAQENAKELLAAQQKIAEAELALKRADTVEASKHAAAVYKQAQAELAKARAAFKAKDADKASTAAAAAKTKAEVAHATAKAIYVKQKNAAAKQKRNLTLQKKAAAIQGITVKLRKTGGTQQLILPVPYLFKRGMKIRPERVAVLNAIAQLLKAYPDYPVIITGYTSFRVPRRRRYVISQGRAQAVVSHFASMGLGVKRFAVNGGGAENRVAARRSRLNDRVEIAVLFQ